MRKTMTIVAVAVVLLPASAWAMSEHDMNEKIMTECAMLSDATGLQWDRVARLRGLTVTLDDCVKASAALAKELEPAAAPNHPPVGETPVPRMADSPECKDITARIIQATDARFDRIAPLGDNVFFQHKLGKDMQLSCLTHDMTGVSINWDGAFPPNAWFALAAKAGQAVTGETRQKLEAGVRKCHRDALDDKLEFSAVNLPKARIECQAFTRDGGGRSLESGSRTTKQAGTLQNETLAIRTKMFHAKRFGPIRP